MPFLILAPGAALTPTDLWVLAGIIAVSSGIPFLVEWWERSRRKAIASLLRAMGFEVQEKDSAINTVEHAPLLGNPLLLYALEVVGNADLEGAVRKSFWPESRVKRATVTWSAMGRYNGKVVRLFEYRYSTYAGRYALTHVHFVAATDLSMGLPPFTIERSRWLMGHRPTMKARDLPVARESPLASFSCYIASEADASAPLTLLAPPVTARLASWGKKPWLRFSNDMLVLGMRKRPGAGDIRPMLDELDQITEAVSTRRSIHRGGRR